MPEGHSIRHLATVHSYGFVGTQIKASSPQGRFSEGASIISGREMTETSAHGKHLFLHFDKDIVHIHLGLYGWFTTRKNKGQVAKDSIRLRIVNEDFVSDLVGPTACEIFSLEAKKLKINKLGPDPIHDDADPEKAWTKIHKSSRSIGGLLMDQSIIAGIGNVYRAELLFLAKLSPFIEGKNLDKEKFNNVWTDSVRLLKLGSEDGKIKTVEHAHLYDDEVRSHGCAQTSYVYKRAGSPCRVCSTVLMSDTLDGRTLYWCPSCQK